MKGAAVSAAVGTASALPTVEECVAEAVRRRIMRGQLFNAYESVLGWSVGIGPVTDHLPLSLAFSAEAADYLVEELRGRAGQPPVSDACRAVAREGQAS
jgi:hypothetical protein